ncbi:conserved Plasmodium protein, unknown function [Plasmodium malariae]|uniref:Uncharacterized protein n=1 Tax=Plasmodium malariae TaxID=5858 RepID=A0A1C3L319_PLAMA|nr:conserved Plasmodium protein, unknown function [Plasmodium malariae]
MNVQNNLMILVYLLFPFLLLTEDIYCFLKDANIKYVSVNDKKNKSNTNDGFSSFGLYGKNNKDDENKSTGGMFQSLFSSMKNILYNEDKIKKDLKLINDNVKEMKEGLVKSSIDIAKQATNIKEDITKNTTYWSNLIKNTISEELGQIDRISKEQLNKLRGTPQHKMLFSTPFQFSSNEQKGNKKVIGKDSSDASSIMSSVDAKATAANVGAAFPYFSNSDNKNEEKKGMFKYLYSKGTNEGKKNEMKYEGQGDEAKKGIRMNPFSFFTNADKKGNTSENFIKEDKSQLHAFFGMKENEKNDGKRNKVDTSNKEDKAWSFTNYFSHKGEQDHLEKKEGGKGSKDNDSSTGRSVQQEEEEAKGFSLNFFSKRSGNAEGDSEQGKGSNNNGRSNVSSVPWFSFTHKKQGEGEMDKAQQYIKIHQEETKKKDDTMNNQNEGDGKGIEKSFSLFNLLKGKEKKKDMNSDNVETDNANLEKSYSTDDGRKKEKKSLFNLYSTFGHNDFALNDENKKWNYSNSESNTKMKIDYSNDNLMNKVKNYYKENKNVDDVKFLSLLNTEHQFDENVDCYPLVAFKGCLSNCFKTISNDKGEEEQHDFKKKPLSVNDYKHLEKCIYKCKNSSLDNVSGGCVQKDGQVLNKKPNYRQYMHNFEKDNVKFDEHPSAFHDFTLKDKYSAGTSGSTNGSTSGSTSGSTGSDSTSSSTGSDSTSGSTGSDSANNVRDDKHVGDITAELKKRNFVDIIFMKDGKKEKTNYDSANIMPGENLSAKLFDIGSNYKQNNSMLDKDNINNSHLLQNSFNLFKTLTTQNDDTSNSKSSTSEGILKRQGNITKGTIDADHTINTTTTTSTNSEEEKEDDDDDDDDSSNHYSYASTSFFLFLLFITFFVYLSAFTNIINQYYVSFKEKICLYLNGNYKATFNHIYGEPSEAFLPKSVHPPYNINSAQDNYYHSFQENNLDLA